MRVGQDGELAGLEPLKQMALQGVKEAGCAPGVGRPTRSEVPLTLSPRLHLPLLLWDATAVPVVMPECCRETSLLL